MIYVTGDCHGDIFKLIQLPNLMQYSLRKRNEILTKDDYVIVCGDFGVVWNDEKSSIKREKELLKKLDGLPFTTLFVDGNHEGFDRLYNCFPVVEFGDSVATKISESVYHLHRGNIYTLQGKTFFCFGGGKSYDIQDGILDIDTFKNYREFVKTLISYKRSNLMFRIKGIDWWKEELPSGEEMDNGIDNLNKHGNKVDFVITHSLPINYVPLVVTGNVENDIVTNYFQKLLDDELLRYDKWFCGHYHIDISLPDNITVLYDNICRIV